MTSRNKVHNSVVTASIASDRDGLILTLPHPTDRSRTVRWNGEAFDLGGEAVRVLAYDVAQSGWTEELTQLHEVAGGSEHFIDVASRSHALGEVEHSIHRLPSVVLEIGASSGFLLDELAQRLPGHVIVGSDYTRGTLETVARRTGGIPLVQFDVTQCPLDDEFADVVIALNVLEHIADDEAAVAQLFRIMRPGGTLVIEVPAGSSLFDVYDRALMHFRRYDMAGLVDLLRRAGFVIDRRSHLGFFLYPAFYLSKRLSQIRHRSAFPADEKKIVAGMISATRKSGPLPRLVMAIERMLRPFVFFPVGIRCLVTCRKPAKDGY
jgi:SAM-dependent methyltransferase